MAKTVLVVDDSAMMRKIVTKNLRESGFDVAILEAADGQEGLSVFKKGGVDVILSDWNMPNMDGITMVKEIRKLDPDKKVPIIMVTTEGSVDKVKEAVLAGANNYLAKPFTPESFKDKLGKLLG
jgi:two-component system chemotaxis response regulator CheY